MTEPTSDWGRGAWMQTFTGRKFFPMDPRPGDVDSIDIAHALSLICRYGGHARKYYSVAEHCVLMSYAVPEDHALWALLHDATEAYVGDMVRPLKHQLPEYQAAEARVMVAIAHRFGLGSTVMPKAVKDADNRILLDERAVVLGPSPEPWEVEHLEPLGVKIRCLPPVVAEFQYANRLRELTNLDSYQWLGMDR